MSDGVQKSAGEKLQRALAHITGNPIVGLFTGMLITMIIQSSGATTVMVISFINAGLLTLTQSVGVIFGANIGTTITAWLVALLKFNPELAEFAKFKIVDFAIPIFGLGFFLTFIKDSRSKNIGEAVMGFGSCADARRSALMHVMFNLFGTTLALIFFKPFIRFIVFISPNDNVAIQISILHTVFKTLNTVLLLPFSKQLVRLSNFLVKDDKNCSLGQYKLEFIETVGKESIAMHIIRVEKEIANMTDVVTRMFDRLQIGISKRDKKFMEEHIAPLEEAENYCDQMHEQIVKYIIKCQHLSITAGQHANLSIMIQISENLEAMSDECMAAGMLLQRSIEKKMKFPEDDMEKLIPYVELARQFLQFIRININKHLDENKLAMAQELEDSIDLFRKNLKKLARKRLESGADVKSELLYLDLTRLIEKIGDNAFSMSGLLSQTA